jgi:pimeloyl-ACP methyl ester carboxylesterase
MLLALLLVVLALGALAAVTLVAARRIEARHPPRGIFVEVTGGKLHVVVLEPKSPAAGAPIVLLHGASANLEDMRVALGEVLSARHRVILIDRPGHGWSDRGGPAGDPAAGEPGRQAALILQALDRLHVDRAIVVGHSWSGALATALALAAPRRVVGLMLLGAVTHPWKGGISWYYDVATTPILGRLFAHTLVIPLGLLMLGGGSRHVFAPQAPPDDYIGRAAIALSLRPERLLHNARDMAGLKASVAALSPRYHEIAAPVAIITGDRDNTVSPDIHSRAIARVLPHARLVVLPGVGHMPHHAAADVIAAEVDRLAQAEPVH